jgi:hypothetical protein
MSCDDPVIEVCRQRVLTETCGETTFWPSHGHIDMLTKDLVKQLRDNNINIGKVIIGSFFGSGYNLPFTKRSLRNLCRQISQEDADEDVPNGGLGSGHKRKTFPERGDESKPPRMSGRCSVCGVPGHWKSTCVKPV